MSIRTFQLSSLALRLRDGAAKAHSESSSNFLVNLNFSTAQAARGGERGDVLNPNLKDDPHIERDLPRVRRQEMKRAQEILGVQHTWLGFVDSGLPEGDPLPPLPEGCFALEPLDVTAEALVREIRRFRPHVMTTYDENGGYPHPDHIMTHKIAVEAFEAAADPERYPGTGEPWQPLKLYYDQTFTKKRTVALHEAMCLAATLFDVGK